MRGVFRDHLPSDQFIISLPKRFGKLNQAAIKLAGGTGLPFSKAISVIGKILVDAASECQQSAAQFLVEMNNLLKNPQNRAGGERLSAGDEYQLIEVVRAMCNGVGRVDADTRQLLIPAICSSGRYIGATVAPHLSEFADDPQLDIELRILATRELQRCGTAAASVAVEPLLRILEGKSSQDLLEAAAQTLVFCKRPG